MSAHPTHTGHLEELDLAISKMDSQASEETIKAVLFKLPGVKHSTLMERGALIHYDKNLTTKDKIVAKLREAGFDVVTFQDSATGETGKVDF